MIYLLAVVDQTDPSVSALAAVTDRDVAVVARGPIAGVGLEWDGRCPDPEPAALRHHNELVDALMRVATVVPFRFATIARCAAEIDGWLAERGGALESVLARLRGRVEMAVRASAEGITDRPRSARGGREYLAALRRDATVGPALADVHRRLSELSAGSLLAGGRQRISASYLVDRERVPAFRRTAGLLAAQRSGVSGLSVTGPWAPYSFVGGIAPAQEEPVPLNGHRPEPPGGTDGTDG